MHDVIQVHRRHLLELMQRYTTVKVKAGAAENDVALAFVVDAELFRVEAAVRWLDSAEVRLQLFPPTTTGPMEATTSEQPAPVAPHPRRSTGRFGARP